MIGAFSNPVFLVSGGLHPTLFRRVSNSFQGADVAALRTSADTNPVTPPEVDREWTHKLARAVS